MSTTSSVFQIQELCDYIVDFLHRNSRALKGCALVSRPLVSSAQYHLFSDVRFGNGVKWNDGGATRRFCVIMRSSPHLRPFVQRIRASFTPDVLRQLCELELPNLRDLMLFRPIMDRIIVPNSTSVAYAAPSNIISIHSPREAPGSGIGDRQSGTAFSAFTYTRNPLSPAIFAHLPALTHLTIASLGTELKKIEIMTWPPEDDLRELGKACASIGCTIEVILRQSIGRRFNKGNMMACVRTAFVEVNERGRLLVAAEGEA
ncbi:hypothetical protein C8R45DRAFT_1216068 [Mycena sanguinolenta]|nr:hypothetical protein C8R45DRAFT_1216068 [Mycena sanguinolenta]